MPRLIVEPTPVRRGPTPRFGELLIGELFHYGNTSEVLMRVGIITGDNYAIDLKTCRLSTPHDDTPVVRHPQGRLVFDQP